MLQNSKLTILMPTYGRSVFIEKILQYYHSHNVEYNFILIDSSPRAEKQKIQDAVSKFSGRLNIKLIDHIRPDDPENLKAVKNEYWFKIIEHASKVTTPYVLCCGDDDFFIPKAIDHIIETLESDTEKSISCATGHSFDFWCMIDRDTEKISLGNDGFIKARCTMDQDDPIKRIINKSYPNVEMGECHSVLRTEVLKELLSDIDRYRLWKGDRLGFFAEQYWNIFCTLKGKCYVSDDLYWVKPRIREVLPSKKERVKDVYNVYLYSHLGQEGYLDKYKETLNLFMERAKSIGVDEEYSQWAYETWFMGIYEMRMTRTRSMLLREYPREADTINKNEDFGIVQSIKILLKSIRSFAVRKMNASKNEVYIRPSFKNLENPSCLYRDQLSEIHKLILS